ncbi:MAG: sodium:proton antiporter [Clostridia bacterium]|nr:sodium:proton antiporter [Clostridia bacterium]
MIDRAYNILFIVTLCAIGVMLFAALIRSIRGPRTVDHIMGVNMTCTMTTLCIAVLALLLDESYLLDVCLIYVLISFLAVVVLAKVFINVNMHRKEDRHD